MNEHTENLSKRAMPRPPKTSKDQPYYTCGKCHHQVAESCLENHLKVCSPNRPVRCGKCKNDLPIDGIVQHFKTCNSITIAKSLSEVKEKLK